MKHTITLIFLLSLFIMACTGRVGLRCGDGRINSTSFDKRCLDFQDEAYKKGTETGVCYRGPLLKGFDPGAKDPNPSACSAIYIEANKKCDALPPAGPGDIVKASGGTVYKGKKPVLIDGKPVCP